MVSQNLSIDANDQTYFSPAFDRSPRLTAATNLEIPANSLPVDFASYYSRTILPKDLTAMGNEIRLTGTIPLRPATGEGSVRAGAPGFDAGPFSLMGDSLISSMATKDLSLSGHGYRYDAFSTRYEKLTAQDVVTMVPTPTALQAGIGGLLVVVGVTAYIRRKSRARMD